MDSDYLDCNPIVSTFNHTNVKYFKTNHNNTIENIINNYNHFPLCSFYSTITKTYSKNGCYLLYFNECYSKRACLHNIFGLKSEHFEPEINYWGNKS